MVINELKNESNYESKLMIIGDNHSSFNEKNQSKIQLN